MTTPNQVPFADGQRYREAGTFDDRNLPLFIADPNGPWLRRHGVLLLFAAISGPTPSPDLSKPSMTPQTLKDRLSALARRT